MLASGSKANSVFVRSGETAILLDCGLSKREAVKRLSGISVAPEELTALVVSHEHNDHIAGVRVLADQAGLPVYMNEPTFNASKKLQEISLHQVFFFQEGVPFTIGSLRLFPFSLSHDAAQPVGFRVTDGEKSISIVTDLGVYDDFILDQVCDTDALLLESNHEPEQLWLSEYPWELKERIAGSYGHLSNEDASKFVHALIKRNAHTRLKFIVAGHVSENSNTYDQALQAIKTPWRSLSRVPHFFVATQNESTECFSLEV